MFSWSHLVAEPHNSHSFVSHCMWAPCSLRFSHVEAIGLSTLVIVNSLDPHFESQLFTETCMLSLVTWFIILFTFHVCGWGWGDNSHYMLDVVHPLRRGPNRGCEWRCYKLHGVMEFRRSSEGMCHSQCLPTCLHFHSLQHSDFVLVVLSFTRFCSAQKWT
jgi:hypothetical protein